MNELTPDDRIEALVRRHLEQQAEAIDAADVLWQVRRRQLAHRRPFVARRTFLRVGALAAAAAVIIVGGIWLDRPKLVDPVRPATARELLAEARASVGDPVDRCYRLQAELSPALLKKLPVLGGVAGREAKLWTRGDRFVIETTAGERNWTWSRNDKGDAWIAFRDGTAVVFTRDELAESEPVNLLSSLYSMELDKLLGEIPDHFELTFAEDAEVPAGLQRIVGTPKPERTHPTVLRPAIDVDPATKLIHRIELHRLLDKDPIGKVTLTLLESAQADDARYSLEARIPPGGQIVDPAKANFQARRRLFLAQIVRVPDDPARP